MHDCEEFRERITEQIIDREDLAKWPELQHELLVCQSCSEFYSESRDMIETFSSVPLDIPEERLEEMTHRLRTRIGENCGMRIADCGLKDPDPAVASFNPQSAFRIPQSLLPALVGVAAVALMAVGVYKFLQPLFERTPGTSSGSQQMIVVDHSLPLDPVTVDFLEQSELLLRNVMKLEPANVEDVQETKRVASRQLLSLDQRREAASEIPPMLTVMEKYETILRDLRNLQRESAAEDIADIQNRIQRNGLIANMKVFQPQVSVIDLGQ